VVDGAGQAAVSAVRGALTFLVELVLGIVAVFFYVKDGDRIAGWLRGLFPPRHQDDASVIGAEVWSAVAGYIRGQAMIATVDGVLVAIGLLILGIPLAITLGVVVFVGAFVPTVGSIVAGAIAVAVALVTEGLVPAVITLAIIVGVQQLEGNILAPVVLGHELHLHPLAVLATITAGAILLGPFGAIVAVPLAASVTRAARYLREVETG
jgi:predicted PurR-regulated permease PerM